MKWRSLPTLIRHYWAAQRRWHRLNQERLAAYQAQRARQMVAYVHRHSPFYHEHWAGHDLGSWETLPMVDKRTMMRHFATFNTAGITYEAALTAAQQAEDSSTQRSILRDRASNLLTAGLSSGTSGERGLFLVMEREIALWAGNMLARGMHGLRWRGLSVAFFLRAHSHLYTGVQSPFLQLRYLDLVTPLQDVIPELNAYRPQVVVGPPSLLGRLATAQTCGALQIAPERLIAVAEVLEPQVQMQLQTQFAAPVHQIYQCTEGLLAISCPHGSLHIQEDLVALQLEPLPTPTDEPPRYTPIVTDLWRTTQPIIRYCLGDLLQLQEVPCPCGSSFRVISAIEGRVADICFFTTPTGARLPFYPAMIRRMVLENSPLIAEYQAIQPQDDHLHLYLETAPGMEFDTIAKQVHNHITATITAAGAVPPTLYLQAGLPPHPPQTKRRRVQRKLA